jgi:hypothetical protein
MALSAPTGLIGYSHQYVHEDKHAPSASIVTHCVISPRSIILALFLEIIYTFSNKCFNCFLLLNLQEGKILSQDWVMEKILTLLRPINLMRLSLSQTGQELQGTIHILR